MPAKVRETGGLRKWLGRLALAVIILVLLGKLMEPTVRRAQLLRACTGADRMIVDFNTWPEETRAKLELDAQAKYEVRDQEAIREFLDLMSFQVNWMNMSCRCYGEVVFRFCRGEGVLASVSLHHDENLRWRDGAWWGDATLVAESRTGIHRWLKDNHVPFKRSSSGLIIPAEGEALPSSEQTPTGDTEPVGAEPQGSSGASKSPEGTSPPG